MHSVAVQTISASRQEHPPPQHPTSHPSSGHDWHSGRFCERPRQPAGEALIACAGQHTLCLRTVLFFGGGISVGAAEAAAAARHYTRGGGERMSAAFCLLCCFTLSAQLQAVSEHIEASVCSGLPQEWCQMCETEVPLLVAQAAQMVAAALAPGDICAGLGVCKGGAAALLQVGGRVGLSWAVAGSCVLWNSSACLLTVCRLSLALPVPPTLLPCLRRASVPRRLTAPCASWW